MSNHSHLHTDEAGREIDAFGTREACDVCRSAAGLAPLSITEQELAARGGISAGPLRGGDAPSETLKADLAAAEAENDALRAQLRDAAPAIARERDEAKEQLQALGRQIGALEQQLASIPELERQLSGERAKVAILEQQLEQQLAVAGTTKKAAK
jgi:hypothetical protein